MINNSTLTEVITVHFTRIRKIEGKHAESPFLVHNSDPEFPRFCSSWLLHSLFATNLRCSCGICLVLLVGSIVCGMLRSTLLKAALLCSFLSCSFQGIQPCLHGGSEYSLFAFAVDAKESPWVLIALFLWYCIVSLRPFGRF